MTVQVVTAHASSELPLLASQIAGAQPPAIAAMRALLTLENPLGLAHTPSSPPLGRDCATCQSRPIH